MQNALKLLAVLPLACASAAAAPAQTKPAAADACRPHGTVIFEIDHRVEPGAKLATSTVKVFGTGAWTRDEADPDGKALATRSGCFAKPDLKQLETTLRGATWKVTMAKIHCMAVSETYTVYQVDGKPVFTDKLCSGASLDDKSRAKLDAATQLVEHEITRSP
jgi:hypothetical protein